MTTKKRKTIDDLLKISALHKESEKENIALYESSIIKASKDLEDMLEDHDLEGLEPMHNPLLEPAYVRADESSVRSIETEKLLSCSKNVKDRYYLVPKFL